MTKTGFRNLNSFIDRPLARLVKQTVISPTARIHPTAVISGDVVVSEGVVIGEYSVIKGPCYIADQVHIGSFCHIRPLVILESGVRLTGYVELKHCLIRRGTHFHSGYIGDSVIGNDCRIGAGFITANRRLDRNAIRVPVGNKLVSTEETYFGCLMGKNVKIGVHCGTNPGTVVPDNTVILPMTMISNSLFCHD